MLAGYSKPIDSHLLHYNHVVTTCGAAILLNVTTKAM